MPNSSSWHAVLSAVFELVLGLRSGAIVVILRNTRCVAQEGLLVLYQHKV